MFIILAIWSSDIYQNQYLNECVYIQIQTNKRGVHKENETTLSNNDYIQQSKLTLKWYMHMYQTETFINTVLILTVFPLSDYKNPFPYVAKSPSC